MKKVFIVVIAGLAALTSSAQHKEFAWLVGTWKLKEKNVFETWTVAQDGRTLLGESYRIKEGDTVRMESIRLVAIGENYYYIPDVAGGQGSVEFVFTVRDESKFRAENPKHDFPKIIQYEFIRSANSSDKINAFIEGDGKRIPYLFERVR